MIDALGIKGRKGGRRRDDEATIGAGIAEALLLRAIPIPHPAASPAPETIPATAMPAGAAGSSPDTVIRTLDIQPIADAAPASPSIAHPIAGPGALTYQAPIAAADGTSIVRPFLITEDAVAFRPLPAQQAIESGAAIIHPLAAATGEAPLMAASFGGGTSHSAPAISVTGTTAVTVDISHLSADAGSVVVEGKTTIALSSLFSVTASSSNPTYLVLSVLDRDEYSAAATGATGTRSRGGS